jgi:hypothetical protein
MSTTRRFQGAGRAADATTAWEQLMHRRHDPATWRRIFDAVDHADRVAGTTERAGPAWCRVAVALAPHLDTPPEPDWYGDRIDANPGLWWRWLNAPVVNVDGPLTVADFLGLADSSRYMPHETACGLIRGAAKAGLFGLANANIEVHTVVDGEEVSGLILVARTSAGAGIATPLITPGLPPHPCGDRIADALAVLTTAADHINDTLDQHEAAVRSADGHEFGRAGRAFPPLTDASAAAPPVGWLPSGPARPAGRSR